MGAKRLSTKLMFLVLAAAAEGPDACCSVVCCLPTILFGLSLCHCLEPRSPEVDPKALPFLFLCLYASYHTWYFRFLFARSLLFCFENKKAETKKTGDGDRTNTLKCRMERELSYLCGERERERERDTRWILCWIFHFERERATLRAVKR